MKRGTFLALTALYGLTEEMGDDPVPPSVEIRALLAILFQQSNHDRGPFEEFWKISRRLYPPGTTGRASLRSTMARTAWNGICASIGVQPGGKFLEAVWAALAQHRATIDPETASRMLAIRAVRVAAAMRVLEATKGRPRSAASARLAAYLRQNKGSPDGFDPTVRDGSIVIEDDPCGWL